MTLRRETSSIDSPHARPQLTPRLRLKPKGSAVGHVDGAWWPHSEELPAELPDLLAVLSVRLGQIGRVSYSFADWSTAPNTLATGDNTVGLRGYYQQQGNTIQVVGIDNATFLPVHRAERLCPKEPLKDLGSPLAEWITQALHDCGQTCSGGRISKMLPYVSAGCWPMSCTA